jgi:hypothetical protein
MRAINNQPAAQPLASPSWQQMPYDATAFGRGVVPARSADVFFSSSIIAHA